MWEHSILHLALQTVKLLVLNLDLCHHPQPKHAFVYDAEHEVTVATNLFMYINTYQYIHTYINTIRYSLKVVG